jgi:hypothetical protein
MSAAQWAIRLAPIALCGWATMTAADPSTRLVALAVLLLIADDRGAR